jgi:adenylate cyclase
VFATLGNGERLEYTVIGEAANLAAKLEKHNKIEATRALVCANTYDLAVAQGYSPTRVHERRGQCRVAGVLEPMDIVALAAHS